LELGLKNSSWDRVYQTARRSYFQDMQADGDADSGLLLFTYGTLMLTTSIPAVDAATRDAGVSLGRGFIHGHLFDLGEYPGAVPLTEGWGMAGAVRRPEDEAEPGTEWRASHGRHTGHEDAPKVWGRLIRLKDPAAFNKVIDAYEGFDPAKPMESEFIRAETIVFLESEEKGHPAQVYYYNFPTHGRVPIETGDYLAFWHAKGRPAQGRSTG
jgi:gamma-glutamylcyclotransferase (GGCT)/AIG2-like uncharacterized protein YtfP